MLRILLLLEGILAAVAAYVAVGGVVVVIIVVAADLTEQAGFNGTPENRSGRCWCLAGRKGVSIDADRIMRWRSSATRGPRPTVDKATK